MNVLLENLEKIDDILNKLNSLEQKISSPKRWLNIKEASEYLGYSKDHIHKIKDTYLIEGKHYHKKVGRILFDKMELDNWVITSIDNNIVKGIVDDIVKDLI